ncbi:Polypeptide N-acetylgalactosaminyltransferase 5 [Lamellibrachia satsuma]|nr:Polypeptide N-acetylgalactosaminyltransferase 5 [Lamellibrachia satsuma]
MQMPAHERRRLRSEAQAHRSPTLVGCAIAVRKDYFHHIGGFDDAMNVWGGENIELAFRTWMCGGQVLTHPCSRVAHTFKPFAYSFDGDREKIVQKNLMRIAELWMDDWKDFFYASTWNWMFKRTSFNAQDLASLERRWALKRKLKCSGFDWYMRTVVPEIPTPPRDATFYGEVTNLKTEACLYEMDDGYIGITYMCFFHRVLPENLFSIDTRQRLVHRGRCAKVELSTYLVRLEQCTPDVETWTWKVERIREVAGVIKAVTAMENGEQQELCLTQVTNINKVHYKEQMPQLLPCDGKFQHWRFQYMFMFDHKFPLG